MKQHIFSIGLNVGASEPAGQLNNALRVLAHVGTVHDVAIGRASWEGVPERFLQARVTLAPVQVAQRIASGLYWWSINAAAYGAAQRLARELQQTCVAVRIVGARADAWRLISAAGEVSEGGSLAEFPIILADGHGASAARVNVPGAPDTVGHSSIQAWSAGEFFPAVIARHDRAGEYAGHELTIGAWSERYASYDDAAAVARYVCQNGRINAARYAEVCDA